MLGAEEGWAQASAGGRPLDSVPATPRTSLRDTPRAGTLTDKVASEHSQGMRRGAEATASCRGRPSAATLAEALPRSTSSAAEPGGNPCSARPGAELRPGQSRP